MKKNIMSVVRAIFSGAVLAIAFVFAKRIIERKTQDKKQTLQAFFPLPVRKHKKVVSESESALPSFQNKNAEEYAAATAEKEIADKKENAPYHEPQHEQRYEPHFEPPHHPQNELHPNQDSPAGKYASMKKLWDIEYTFFLDYPKCSMPEAKILIHNGEILVEAERFTFSFGMDMVFNASKSTITLLYEQNAMVYEVETNQASFNGEKISVEQGGEIVDGIAFIPVKFTSEHFGFNVEINERDRIMFVRD